MTETLTSSVLSDVLSNGNIRSVFQPIVDIDNLEVVAYEALSRGPAGSVLESPVRLLAAAYEENRIADLDWACRRSALEAALEAGLERRTSLFVNVEPATLGTDPPFAVAKVQDEALREMQVVLEITERAITARPAEILQAARWARGHGWAIALDDLGADPGSLALLPLLEPDVVKLDLALVQGRPDREIASIMSAVLAYAERSGAAVLAEGIETQRHLATARSLGARFGQGYLFGRPGPLSLGGAVHSKAAFLKSRKSPHPGRTPFEVVAAERRTRLTTKAMLVEISKHLEAEALVLTSPAVVLSAFQEARNFTPSTAVRYGRLAAGCPLVSAIGNGLSSSPLPGVRGSNLEPDDPLSMEWSVVVIGAHYSAALVARDLGDDVPQPERRFEYALTFDDDLVADSARSLLGRVLPVEADVGSVQPSGV